MNVEVHLDVPVFTITSIALDPNRDEREADPRVNVIASDNRTGESHYFKTTKLAVRSMGWQIGDQLALGLIT